MAKIIVITSIVLLAIMMSYQFQSSSDDSRYAQQRQQMVEQQIIARGINDPSVLAAMRATPRHLFVPPETRSSAYQDHPLPIGYQQTISQPFIVAYMTASLNLRPQDKVLEIGTGSGYQAAVLAEVVKEVYTIEIVAELAASARTTLTELGYRNVHVKHGDGFQGWPEFAPFDAILVTAAPEEIPSNLVDQLAIGGRMIIPVGATEQQLYLLRKTEQGIDKQAVLPVRFVPMTGGHQP